MISSLERAKFEQLDLKTLCLCCYNFSSEFPHVHIHTHTLSLDICWALYFFGWLCAWWAAPCVCLSGGTRSDDLSALQTWGEGASLLSTSASPLNIRTWTRRPLTFRKISASKERARNKRILSFKGQSRQLLKRHFQTGLSGCDRVCVLMGAEVGGGCRRGGVRGGRGAVRTTSVPKVAAGL